MYMLSEIPVCTIQCKLPYIVFGYLTRVSILKDEHKNIICSCIIIDLLLHTFCTMFIFFMYVLFVMFTII